MRPSGHVGTAPRLPSRLSGSFGAKAAGIASAAVRQPVVATVLRRAVLSVPLLVIVTGIVFVLINLLPGNVTWQILGDPRTSGLPKERYVELAHQLGVDRPLPVQYERWVAGAIHGRLGSSLLVHQPVMQEISQRWPVTLSLALGALIMSTAVGVGLGVASAVRGGVLGKAVDVIAMTGWVVPLYWLGAELVVIFAVKLHWLPAIGYVPFSQSRTGWLRSLILPVIALSVGPIGGFAKFTRQAMLDALSSEYIRIARANGISPISIIFRHAFKTAALQVVTLAGLLTVALLAGTVFAENVFALPGLGSLMVVGTTTHDFPVVQGIALFFTLVVIAVNLVVDLLYTLLSPKVHVR